VSNLPETRGDVTALSPGQTSIIVNALGLSTTLLIEVDP
jgi:hypothetical protein